MSERLRLIEPGWAFLHACLGNTDNIFSSGITVEHFSGNAERAVWRIMQELAVQNNSLDLGAVVMSLGQEHALDAYRGLDVATSRPESAAKYAQQLKDTLRARKTLAVLDDAAQQLRAGGALTDALSVIAGIEHGDHCRETSRLSDDMDAALVAFDDAKAAREQGKPLGIGTGVPTLDRYLGRLQPGRMIVVGGRPKMGKTAMAMTIALNAARAGHDVGVINTEMSVRDMGSRAWATLTGIDPSAALNGSLPESDWERMTAARKQHRDWLRRIRCVYDPAPTPQRTHDYVRTLAALGCELIIVDYLQRLEMPTENRHAHVGKSCRLLKTASTRANVCVLLLSQLNRGLENRAPTDRRPRPSDLRDSGEIEQEADQVIFLYRPSVYDQDGKDEIILSVNRHGETGIIVAKFVENRLKWVEVTSVHGQSEYDPATQWG